MSRDLRRVRMAFVAVCVGLAITSLPSRAQPAADSLRLRLSDTSVELTWEAGVAPYGIYRSSDPSGVADGANYVGVSTITRYADPLALQPGVTILFFTVDTSPRCNKQFNCSNGNPCDGTERCSDRRCVPGIDRIDCNDGDACTIDTCSPVTGACGNAPLDCEDGDPCTIDTCVPLAGCESTVDPAAGIGTAAELAGNPLASYPGFEFARAFHEDAGARVAIDPARHPDLVGQTCDVYVVESKGAAGWCSDPSLADARGAPDTRTFVAGGTADNTYPLIAPLQLPSQDGPDVGRGYDVVLDCDRNGLLGADELADGLLGRSGLYLLHDLTAAGPLAVSQFDEIGPAPNYCESFFNPGLDDMRVYYPALLDDPDYFGTFPLAVISHGNGHCFDWYDFLGQHIASYGYIVMAHDNDTRPGIEAASTTTLSFTDRILQEQDTLGGGVLDGHIDDTRIGWLGHSRGGEGIVRAYDRLVDEAFPAQSYTAEDILVLSSIAPTDFLGPSGADPHDVSYHLLYGSSDGDVCGCPNSLYPFAIYERATGHRHATYLHGADHNDFNCCGFNDFAGPAGTEIGRAEAQQWQKAAQLAALERYVKGRYAVEDYFWRQAESFRPVGTSPDVVSVHEYRKAPFARSFVIEDYQAEPNPAVSSSGGAVDFDVANLEEALLVEQDGQFAWTGLEPTNGMTRTATGDDSRGAVFEYGGAGDVFYRFEVVPAERDFTDDTFLSFRAAQATRHPQTIAETGDLAFTVTLEDGLGNTSSIRIDAYGGGIEEPYARGGFGTGFGWQNEFETIRIRLTDFLAGGPGLDLTDVRFVRFDFGPGSGSAAARLGFDDLELTEE